MLKAKIIQCMAIVVVLLAVVASPVKGLDAGSEWKVTQAEMKETLVGGHTRLFNVSMAYKYGEGVSLYFYGMLAPISELETYPLGIPNGIKYQVCSEGSCSSY